MQFISTWLIFGVLVLTFLFPDFLAVEVEVYSHFFGFQVIDAVWIFSSTQVRSTLEAQTGWHHIKDIRPSLLRKRWARASGFLCSKTICTFVLCTKTSLLASGSSFWSPAANIGCKVHMCHIDTTAAIPDPFCFLTDSWLGQDKLNYARRNTIAVGRNRIMHALNGNTCPHCHNYLTSWVYYNLPNKFRSRPIPLCNGMLVHHSFICKHHTSVWFYRRGQRRYESFTGNARLRLNQQLVAAGAAKGLPGDHGPSIFRLFCQNQYNVPHPRTSGHEPCSAAGGRRHQNLRSAAARFRRVQTYQIARAQSRRSYRLWKAQLQGWRSSTLVSIPSPRKRCKLASTPSSAHTLPICTLPSPLHAPSSFTHMSRAIVLTTHLPG